MVCLIDDDLKALHLLEQIGYYRLSGYWYPLLDFPRKDHKFKEQAKFSTVYNLYCFDNELKQLVSTALAKIEVSVRAKMIYSLWESNDAFWHTNGLLLYPEVDDKALGFTSNWQSEPIWST